MSVDRSVAVGVEIGGGKTTVALVDRHGRVLCRSHTKTLHGRPALATLDPYLREIDVILAQARAEGLQVCGVGVSLPGAIDHNERRPCCIPLLPSLNKFPLCELLETRFHLPVLLHADVDAAILGEYRFGAGQGFRRLLFLTVNAVVGASLVVDGELVRSTQQYFGHVCHLSVGTNGSRCSCGKRGCINSLVSVEAMQKMVQRALRRGEETSLIQRFLNHEYFTPRLLAEEAVRGDMVALQVYGEVGRWLGAAVAKYTDLFEINALILGGGMLYAGDLLLSQVRSALVNSVSEFVEVVPACLESDATLIGAVVQLF